MAEVEPLVSEPSESSEPTLKRSRVRVSISRDRLTATVAISEPTSSEPPVTESEVTTALEAAGVKVGINHDAIIEAITSKHYGQAEEVAHGKPPIPGKSTEIEYFFQEESRFQPQVGKDGRIDYRDMGFVQNATKGMLLAKRTAAEEGTPGLGVDDRPVPATPGKNIPFTPGDNVEISADGLELRAKCDGAIFFSRGVVSVKDIMTVKDVDFNVGNIECVGSVRVGGDVCTGFTIRAGGDLEVSGNVEDARIHAKGNILVRGGFFGGDGILECEGDATVKYAQGQTIVTGGDLTVGGELVNCHVTAGERVFVKGNRGTIVGGEIIAGKEIQTLDIGSPAGTPTEVIVALDRESLRKYHEVVKEITRLKSDGERVKDILLQLSRLRIERRLTKEQEATSKKLDAFMKSLPTALEALEKTKQELEAKLQVLSEARIAVKGSIFPGVKVYIGCHSMEVNEPLRKVVLTQDGTQIVVSDLTGAA